MRPGSGAPSWDPLPLGAVGALFSSLQVPWWVAGGWAIDVHVGRPTREHADVDVLVLREHLSELRSKLEGWDLHAADPPGTPRLWTVGERLPLHVHDVWCRPGPGNPWRFQLMVDDTEGGDWCYRRDPRIRRPVESLTGPASTAQLPVLTPEVQLLYKSRQPRPKDHADFACVLPVLTDEQRDWLDDALRITAPSHPWRALLAGGAGR